VDRRAFIGTLTGGFFAAPLAAEAQQVGKVPRVGCLWPGKRDQITHLVDAFEVGLRGLGYTRDRPSYLSVASLMDSLTGFPSLLPNLCDSGSM
jgi:hypothetical protein